MSSASRPLLLASIALLVCSLFAVAAPPVPAYAQTSIIVNTTRDLPGPACYTFQTLARPEYINYCSLRQALNQALGAEGNATIAFAIPTFDATFNEPMPGFDITTFTWTIVLGFIDPSATPLPVVASPLTPINKPNIYIAGDTQADFTGISQQGPQIFIDGTYEDTAGGISVTGTSNITIERLGLINFGGNPAVPGDLGGVGIELFNTTDSLVVGCYIGVGQDGLTPAPNDAAGILVQGGSNNTIGGKNSDNDKYNVISGNTNDGILIRQGASNTVIIGNRIGVDTNGNVAIPNGENGIQIELFATGTRIGSLENQPDNDETLRNTIAGNGGYGIFIDNTSGNFVYGNWIGADNLSNVRLPNQDGGILIRADSGQSASNNVIGGNTPKSRNIISGNNGPGVAIVGEQARNNVVANNWIGVGFSFTTAVSNTIGVLLAEGPDDNIIGGNGNTARNNVISGNSQEGIVLYGIGIGPGPDAQRNIISGNLIGVAPNGTTAMPNGASNNGSGILVLNANRETQIGGATQNHRNIISNNTGDGIEIVGTLVFTPTIGANTIQRNGRNGIYIEGTTTLVSGASITGVDDSTNRNQITNNTLVGVEVIDAQLTTISQNVVSQNGQSGIVMTNALSSTLQSNLVEQNTGAGILVGNGTNTTMLDNIVTRNTVNGVQLSGSTGALLQFGEINRNTQTGVLVDSGSRDIQIDNTNVFTNGLAGIQITGSSAVSVTSTLLRGNTGAGIGMNGPLQQVLVNSNEIVSNGANGITIVGVAPTTGITITSNLLQQNIGSGVRITGDLPASGNQVNVRLSSNAIIANSVDGVHVGDGGAGPHPQRVRITGNGFRGNGIPPGTPAPVPPALYGRGIVLDPDTAGGAGTATNPNHDIEPPFALAMSQAGVLTGRVLADGSNSACMPVTSCVVQIFATDAISLDGQGLTPIGVPEALTANGYFTATLGAIPNQLAVTATDGMSNTSEFALFTPAPAIDIEPDRAQSAKPGDVITYTHRVTNTGNIAFTSLRLTTEPASLADGWTRVVSPSGTFSLAPGESRPVELFVTLPTGNNAPAGTVNTTRLTVSSGVTPNAMASDTVTDTTTVLERVVLSVSPTSLSGSGPPNSVIPYVHTVTNNGNIAATVEFGASTTVGGAPAPTWGTTVEPATMTLPPGESGAVTVRVTVSSGAQAGPPPTVAQTTLYITPTNPPDLSQVKIVTDTTTTLLEGIATMVPDREGDAGATETISFRHVVTNNSNGTATFRLNAGSSLGSTITFTSDTPGVTLVNGNTFTLSNIPGQNTFTFLVNITVARRALPGEQDLVTIFLTDAQGGVIGGASVQDTINVTSGVVLPRLYLPIVIKP